MVVTIKHIEKANYLLDKGLHVLWDKGYNGTSVNDIVKAAGVPKGSFYFYFESKEDFAVKAIDRYFVIMTAPVSDILDNKDEPSALKRLFNLLEYKNQTVKDEFDCVGCMACNVTAEMANHSEKIRNVLSKNENEFRGNLIAILKEAQEMGEVSTTIIAENIIPFIEDAWKGAMITVKMSQDHKALDNALAYSKLLLTR